MKSAARWAALALATGLFLSYLPARLMRRRRLTGAGLVGSLWGVALIAILPLNPFYQTLVWLAVLILSIIVSDVAEDILGVVDDPRIVIDEVIGMCTALLFLPHSVSLIALGFILFRLFDVLKPSWIRRAGELPGGWGVVFDDVLAGVAANLVLRVVQLVHPL